MALPLADQASKTGGVVYEMMRKASGWTFNVLYDFCLQYYCPDGGGPQSGVILDASDNLYGTTGAGGEYGDGIVFELTSGSGGWDEAILHSFNSVTRFSSASASSPTAASKLCLLFLKPVARLTLFHSTDLC